MRFAPVTFSEEDGVRYLHFGTPWIQGAMRLKKPFAIELEYAQQMMLGLLLLDQPRHVVQLGLGAAALTKFAWRHLPQAQVTAVELNPEVIAAAHAMFCLPEDDDRLTVLAQDAGAYLERASVPGTIDLLQIDLYDATARGPVLDSVDFYRAARASLRDPGVVTVNLFGDHPSFTRNLKHLQTAFEGRVAVLPEVHAGNRIALALKGPPLAVSWEDLYERAAVLERRYELPAATWVHGLKLGAGRHVRGALFRL